LLNRQYDAVVRDLLGVTTLASADDKPPSELLYADYEGDANADALRLYQEVGDMIATEVMTGPNRSMFISCDPASAGCLTQTIRTFGRKAFRRPLTDEEVQRFEELGNTTPPGTPEEIAHTTLLAFLVSPSFLHITELATEREGNAIKLSHHEVAARLSFLLWDSIPDDILDAAADNGELGTQDQILDQARRMVLVREKAAPRVTAAHHSYLEIGSAAAHWWTVSHDTAKYPLFSDAVVRAFKAELDSLIEDVAYTGGAFQDLFLSNVGYVNQETAPIYGLDPGDYGAELTRVELDPTERPGLLTRGAFLSSFAHFDSTAPTLRGAFITVKILNLNPGAAHPDAVQRPPPAGEYTTQRAYAEALTSPAECKGCHVYLDPPGFVLEVYDPIGKWQTVDPRGGAIQPAAEVFFRAQERKCIGSPRELMEELSATPSARRRYAESWVSFATRRLPNANDDCDVNAFEAKLSQDEYSILDLFADLTQRDSFRLRVRAQ
jgi:hypothetical protein